MAFSLNDLFLLTLILAAPMIVYKSEGRWTKKSITLAAIGVSNLFQATVLMFGYRYFQPEFLYTLFVVASLLLAAWFGERMLRKNGMW